MKYLILFTINPVQSFISQARKTRDLYDGSKLLSDLIKFASEDVDTVFPVKTLDSLPNRFLGIKEFDTDAGAKDYLKALEMKVRKKFSEICFGVIRRKAGQLTEAQTAIISRQIDSHLQNQWAVTQYNPDNYQSQFDEIESLLGSVKNIRTFAQISETGRKCSLCGERNLIFCSRGNKKELKPNWKLLTAEESAVIKEFNNSINIFFSVKEGFFVKRLIAFGT